MTKYVLLFAFLVSLANIGLNYLATTAAAAAANWSSIFFTRAFVLAFAVGTASLVFMMTLYYFGKNNQFGMANGILLMGAASIVGGTLIGYFQPGSRVLWSEWTIFALILLFVFIRFLKAVNPS